MFNRNAELIRRRKRMNIFGAAVNAVVKVSYSAALGIASGVRNSVSWYKKHVTWS